MSDPDQTMLVQDSTTRTAFLIFVVAWQEVQHTSAFLDTMHAEPCSRSGSKVDLPCAPTPHARSKLPSSTPTHSRYHCLKRGPAQKVLYERCRTCVQESVRAAASPSLRLGISVCPVQH